MWKASSKSGIKITALEASDLRTSGCDNCEKPGVIMIETKKWNTITLCEEDFWDIISLIDDVRKPQGN